jgi:hypothetical protein
MRLLSSDLSAFDAIRNCPGGGFIDSVQVLEELEAQAGSNRRITALQAFLLRARILEIMRLMSSQS